jgi:hypothetical protein
VRIFFDTEFIETPASVTLVSIGLVRDDGLTYYAESTDYDPETACPWMRENVLSKLHGGAAVKTPIQIADGIRAFVGSSPEFWGYEVSYDWYLLCRLYGGMLEVPGGWPNAAFDVSQFMMHTSTKRVKDRVPNDDEHDALSDALWTRRLFNEVVKEVHGY